MSEGQFTLQDFLDQLRQIRKPGSLERVVRMLPGGDEMCKKVDMDRQEKEFRRMEGIVCAMTFQERNNPSIFNAGRCLRVARGCGVQVSDVDNLLSRFDQLQRMIKKKGD